MSDCSPVENQNPTQPLSDVCSPRADGKCNSYVHSLRVLKSVLMLGAVLWLISDSALKLAERAQVGKQLGERRTITVTAEGKESVQPDIATLSIGLVTEGFRVAEIQTQNSYRLNKIIEALKKLGLDKKDLQTSGYSISPRYDYPHQRRLIGFTLSQTIAVKIRDLTKVSEVLEIAGTLGANEVGGLQFTLDDRGASENAARAQAIEKAKAKADLLARQAGFKLGKIVSFSEYAPTPYPPVYYSKALALRADQESSAPTIESGTLEVNANVTFVYEIE